MLAIAFDRRKPQTIEIQREWRLRQVDRNSHIASRTGAVDTYAPRHRITMSVKRDMVEVLPQRAEISDFDFEGHGQ